MSLDRRPRAGDATLARDREHNPVPRNLPVMSDRGDPTPDATNTSRTAVELVENLNQALENLRSSTRFVEKVARRSITMLENGADTTTALAAAVPSEARSILNDALKQLDEARHEIRLFAFARSLEQGVSVAELARQYGFSRQLAARYARDARDAREKRRRS
jgi:hypothetical protein